MTKRTRSWFFQGSMTTPYRRFLTNNRPNQSTMADLTDSIIFSTEPGDKATETIAGHVKLVNKEELAAEIDIDSDGFQLVVKPSFLPKIDIAASSTLLPQDDVSANGINIKSYQSVAGKIEFIIKTLIDTGYLKFDASNQITFADDIVQLLEDLSELLDPDTGLPDINLGDFPSEVFDYGGIINNGGVITIDTDDDTMEVVPGTGKVQVKDNGITLAKLQELSAGDIIVGPTGDGTPEIISLIGTDNIIVGTATGVQVVDLNTYLSGLSISDSSILARKINASTLGNGLTRDTAASDTSQMHVDLASAASMEFSGSKLQLENDASGPGFQSYYGTDSASASKGWKSLASYSEQISIAKSTPAATTTMSIDIETEVLNLAGTAIERLNITADLYYKTGTGPDTYAKITDPAIVQTITMTGGGTYVESIDYTGLTASTDYYVVVDFKRVVIP